MLKQNKKNNLKVNKQDMAGVLESQTNTCCCKACWKGTETDSSLASWDRSGRNMLHKYANNMHLYVKKMKKIGRNTDCIQCIGQTVKGYA